MNATRTVHATIAHMEATQAEVVVVTGASRGIGRLLALHLAANGHRVVGMARPSNDLESLADATGQILPIAVDVTDPGEVRRAFATVVEQLAPPTTVVMSAGSIGALGPVVDIDADRWWQAVAVDLRGTMLTVQAALRSMLPLHSGRLITVYGNLGDRGTPNVSAFSAAKAGVARLTETVANEVQGTGITVIGLHPGFVRTPMTEHLAWSDEGQRWLPTFRPHAEKNWMSGDAAAAMVVEIMAGRADSLGGRILYAGDDITTLVRRTADAPDLRRLRVQP